MENASKALLMAASVLIGVMILSLGAYLFTQFGGTSKQINDRLTESQISKFNSQFTKYEGQTNIRAHDIVSIANLAKQNNKEYYGDSVASSKSEPYYIAVKVDGTNYFETKSEAEYQDFIKNNSLKADNKTPITYKCTSVTISNVTKFVKSIEFTKNS